VEWIYFLEGPYLNTPDRADYYRMQTAAEIRRGNVDTKRTKVSLKDFLLKFKNPPKMETKSRIQQSKAAWFGWLSMNRKKQ